MNGTNYTAAGIQAALTPILPAGATATVAGFAGGTFNNTGFQVTYTGGARGDERAGDARAARTSPRARPASSARPTRAARSTTRAASSRRPATRSRSSRLRRQYTIPLRTPFALTGSATDADGDALIYSWEQNDRGGARRHVAAQQHEDERPAVRDVPEVGRRSARRDTLLYDSPGENHLTTSPTRVFPDLQQILDNNTNAETGACPTAPIAPPVPHAVKECFAEFLPTATTSASPGVNASPLSLHFRLTARDGKGGDERAPTRRCCSPTGTGPFLVTAPNTAATWTAGSTRTVTWDVAGTERGAGQRDEREDLALDRRRAHVPVRARGEHAERRLARR